MSEKKSKQKVQVKVLTGNHYHRGRKCKPGDVIAVGKRAADRMIEKKTGERVTAAGKATETA